MKQNWHQKGLKVMQNRELSQINYGFMLHLMSLKAEGLFYLSPTLKGSLRDKSWPMNWNWSLWMGRDCWKA
jgi:hypothetical protein